MMLVQGDHIVSGCTQVFSRVQLRSQLQTLETLSNIDGNFLFKVRDEAWDKKGYSTIMVLTNETETNDVLGIHRFRAGSLGQHNHFVDFIPTRKRGERQLASSFLATVVLVTIILVFIALIRRVLKAPA